MNDIMVDLETMDNIGSSSILSIGAIQCNLITGETGEEFYKVVNLEGQADLGLTMDAQTIYWWLGQSKGATDALLTPGKVLLEDMCNSFNKWLKYCGKPSTMRLWGNGASFDNAILRNAFKRCDIDFPLPFWNDRDMRTIVGFYPKALQETYRYKNIRSGTHHNALDDSRHQIKYCSHILQELGVEELY